MVERARKRARERGSGGAGSRGESVREASEKGYARELQREHER